MLCEKNVQCGIYVIISFIYSTIKQDWNVCCRYITGGTMMIIGIGGMMIITIRRIKGIKRIGGR